MGLKKLEKIMLLQSILEKEYCDISYALDGQKALDELKSSLRDKKPYDIIFLDKHMPNISGTDVLKEYKRLEQKSSGDKIFSISITGDPLIDEEEKNLYDLLISKPFNKSEIRDAFARGK
jgi:CheY-like chemotaxis protein